MLIVWFRLILLPAVLCILLWRYPFRSRVSWWAHSVFTLSWTVSNFVFMEWSALSYYLRYMTIIITIITAIVSYSRFRKRTPSHSHPSFRRLRTWGSGLYLLAAVYQASALLFMIPLIREDSPGASAAHLVFPLRGGPYTVLHGGNHVSLNYHYAHDNQKYAVDIIALNHWGRRQPLVGCHSNTDCYPIFGETVYSPASGEVIQVYDQSDDNGIDHNKGFTASRKSANNAIVIQFGDYHIYLLHIQQGSALVREGDWVEAMQPIAKVGNSGNSSEPHLHIHAARVEQGELLPVPMLFGDIALKRNDLIWNGKVWSR